MTYCDNWRSRHGFGGWIWDLDLGVDLEVEAFNYLGSIMDKDVIHAKKSPQDWRLQQLNWPDYTFGRARIFQQK